MEATVFTGWIYDHLQRHAAALKARGSKLSVLTVVLTGPDSHL